jgi:hypothetical protein
LQYDGVIADFDYHIVDNTDIVWTRVEAGERVPYRGDVTPLKITDDVRPNVGPLFLFNGRYLFNDLFRDIHRSETIPIIAYDDNDEVMDFNDLMPQLFYPFQFGGSTYDPAVLLDTVVPMDAWRGCIWTYRGGYTNTNNPKLTSIELQKGNTMVDHLLYYSDEYISIIRLCPPDDNFVDDDSGDDDENDDTEEGTNEG